MEETGDGIVIDWPHQIQGHDDTEAAIAAGHRAVCLTTPTGGGKTRIACKLIDTWIGQGHKVALYTNRKMLVDQLSGVLDKAGIDHGIRASGHSDEGKVHRVQVSSIQTEDARVNKRKTWQLHDAQRVLIDECHIQKADVARGIMDTHIREGAHIVGLTATPLGIGDIYHHLVVAGTTSSLRACGALVPLFHYGPDEPDMQQFGKAARAKLAAGQDLSEADQRSAFTGPGIFGRVLEWYEKLNPQHRPTILFASGVSESLWFAEQFWKAGITAAHIDGAAVWINGDVKRSSRTARDEVLEGSRDGGIKVICNRFVLREGIDAPWLAHGIFAAIFGSIQSYLQSGGRLLRSHPGLSSVTLQDHGGNWWRHGSLNADREWRLDYDAAMLAGLREERMRRKKEREPCRCPECGLILAFLKCPCGYVVKAGLKPSRPVVQKDGVLKPMHGDIFKPRRVCQAQNAVKDWERQYWRSRESARTFRAAIALYAYEHNWGFPGDDWPFMPREEGDLFRSVKSVAMDRLYGGKEWLEAKERRDREREQRDLFRRSG